MPELNVGLGIWHGEFDGITRAWLRWYDAEGNWLLTDTEQERQRAEQERLAKEQTQAQLLQAAQRLLQSGMTALQVSEMLGLAIAQVQALQREIGE